MDRRWIAGAAMLVVMACSGMSGPGAQAQQPTMQQPGVKGSEVEGCVRDVRGEQVTLSNGTRSMIKARPTRSGTARRSSPRSASPRGHRRAPGPSRLGAVLTTRAAGGSPTPAIVQTRLVLKNSLSRLPHSAARTPAVTSTR
jgi:hypothetical protein